MLQRKRMDPGDAQALMQYLQQMQGGQGGPPQQMPQAAPQQGGQSGMTQLSPDQQMNQAAIQALMNYDYMKAGQFWSQALKINPQNMDAARGLQRVQQIMSQTSRVGRSATEGFR